MVGPSVESLLLPNPKTSIASLLDLNNVSLETFEVAEAMSFVRCRFRRLLSFVEISNRGAAETNSSFATVVALLFLFLEIHHFYIITKTTSITTTCTIILLYHYSISNTEQSLFLILFTGVCHYVLINIIKSIEIRKKTTS